MVSLTATQVATLRALPGSRGIAYPQPFTDSRFPGIAAQPASDSGCGSSTSSGSNLDPQTPLRQGVKAIVLVGLPAESRLGRDSLVRSTRKSLPLVNDGVEVEGQRRSTTVTRTPINCCRLTFHRTLRHGSSGSPEPRPRPGSPRRVQSRASDKTPAHEGWGQPPIAPPTPLGR